MVPYVAIALVDSKLGAEGRKDLFDWLSRQLSGLSSFAEAAQLLKPASSAMTDKSSDVRKAAEACINEILRVSGPEMIEKIVKDIHGPALSLVLEKIKPHGAFQESFEPARASTVGVASKGVSKVGKSTTNGVSKHGNRAVSSEDRERMVVRRFKFEDPRIEQIQDLEKDMMKYFREDLHRRLLSADFKKQIDGIEMLQEALPSIANEIIEVLDILLRWFVLQFCKSNTTGLLKVLEFLPELLDTLKDEGYSLTESEVAIFLPCLTEKLGHNIEKVREKMRELTKQFVVIYSASKCFPYILEGLRSKNNRTRIECADLIGFILDHHGAEISGQLKSLQIVASLTAERDGEIRKAALNALATGYKILGEDIWRFVGKLTDAQKSMLDDRFKWKVREMEKKKEGKPGEARAILRRSVRENGCKYGASCRYNHPDRIAINPPIAALAPSVLTSSAANLNIGVINPATSVYQAFDPRLSNPMSQVGITETIYPQRPGQIECDYYMKTGKCTFGDKCKFHHPVDRTAPSLSMQAQPAVKLTPAGLPRREGVEICPYYLKTGTCKFGATCKFDHPPPGEVLEMAKSQGISATNAEETKTNEVSGSNPEHN